jgi:uncharacterized protein (TIGR01370 family)
VSTRAAATAAALLICIGAVMIMMTRTPPGPGVGASSVGPTGTTSMSATEVDHEERLRDLRAVASWAPVFGGVDAAQLTGYDLLVVDGSPDRDGHTDTSAEDVRGLQQQALVLAYVSVGTLERWRGHVDGMPDAALLDPVEDWPGEWYVDARDRDWQDRLLRLTDGLVATGFDGFYLDNLDVAEDYPQTAVGVVELVTRLRERHPGSLLIAQNGLSVLDRLPVDAISHEDVFWRWDDGYRASSAAEQAPLLSGLRRARQRGLVVLTLDYTEPGCACADEVVARSRAEGFVPAVSVLDLDRPPHTPTTDR